MTVEAQPRGHSLPSPPDAWFEDFAVGQRVTTGLRPVGSWELAARDGAVRPFPGMAFLGVVSESGVLPGSLLRVLGAEWRELGPLQVGDTVEASFTVTRCRRVPDEAAGSVRWHVLVRDGQGRARQEGTVTALLPERPGSDGSGDPVGRAFGTLPWGRALAERLAEDPRFVAATATWDGAIGLRVDGDQVQLRVYRGRVVEVAHRTPHGATFTVEAAGHAWTDLLTGPSNDYFRRTMSGDDFTVTGNAYEYLRMTKALMAVMDAARSLATEEPA